MRNGNGYMHDIFSTLATMIRRNIRMYSNDAISQPYKTYFRFTNSIRLSESALSTFSNGLSQYLSLSHKCMCPYLLLLKPASMNKNTTYQSKTLRFLLISPSYIFSHEIDFFSPPPFQTNILVSFHII